MLDWGPSNFTVLEDKLSPLPGVVPVEAWRVLRIDAYIKDIEIPHGDRYENCWLHQARFWVMNWADIEPTFARYFGTAGLYHRVSFCVEVMTWTENEGWSYEDCM